jgi:hypothetical protein
MTVSGALPDTGDAERAATGNCVFDCLIDFVVINYLITE